MFCKNAVVTLVLWFFVCFNLTNCSTLDTFWLPDTPVAPFQFPEKFPVPPHSTLNKRQVAGQVIFVTTLSNGQLTDFYRATMLRVGLIEDTTASQVSEDDLFSLTFSNWPGGKPLVIQAAEPGDGHKYVTARVGF